EKDAALTPALPQGICALLRFGVDSVLVVGAVRGARRRVGRYSAALGILHTDLPLFLRRPWAVGHRDAVIRRSLAYHELLGFHGDDRSHLNPGRTRADQADTFAKQIGILPRPRGGEGHI